MIISNGDGMQLDDDPELLGDDATTASLIGASTSPSTQPDDNNLGAEQLLPHVDNFTLLCGLITSGFEDMKGMVGQITSAVIGVIDKVETQSQPDWHSEEGRLALFKKRCDAIQAATGAPLSEATAMQIFSSIYAPAAPMTFAKEQVDFIPERNMLEGVMVASGQQLPMTAGPMAQQVRVAGGPPLSGLSSAYGATLFNLGR